MALIIFNIIDQQMCLFALAVCASVGRWHDLELHSQCMLDTFCLSSATHKRVHT